MSADDDVLRAMGLLNIDINDRQQVEGVCRRLLGRVWGWRDERRSPDAPVCARAPPPPLLPSRPLPFLGTGPGIWPLLPAGARSQQAEVGTGRRQGCLGNAEAAEGGRLHLEGAHWLLSLEQRRVCGWRPGKGVDSTCAGNSDGGASCFQMIWDWFAQV